MSFPDAAASDVGGVRLSGGSFEGEALVVFLEGDAISVELTLMSSLVALKDVFHEEEGGEPLGDVSWG